MIDLSLCPDNQVANIDSKIQYPELIAIKLLDFRSKDQIMPVDQTFGRKSRIANVEAFRCGLMFLIVLYHCFIHGVFNDSKSWWAIFFTTFLMWHVAGFIAISGWFGIKWSLNKFFKLFGSVFFYSFLSFIYACIRERELKSLLNLNVTAGWFGGTYLMLMMLAPMLNILVEGLYKLVFLDLIKIWGLFAIAMTLTWAPRNLFTGVNAAGAGGHSIIMFIFVYLTVRLIRHHDSCIRRKHVACCILIFLVGILSLGLLSCIFRLLKHTEINGSCVRAFCSINAPYMWLMSIAMMVWFGKFFRVSPKVGSILQFIGPSMFGIYLCHDTTSFGPLIYRIPENWLLQNTMLHPAVIILLCAIETFGVCLLIDLARRGAFNLVGRVLINVKHRFLQGATINVK